MPTTTPIPHPPPDPASPTPGRRRGPWTHRILVHSFSVLFAVLVYWLLGFVLRDIGAWPGPDYAALESARMPAGLADEVAELTTRSDTTRQAMSDDRQRQTVLRDSTANSERTMNQLLELQRLAFQQGLTPTEPERESLAESQRLFLEAQRRYQEINERVATRTETLAELDARKRELDRQMEAARRPIREEHARLNNRHQWRLAAFQLGFLLPLLGGGVWVFVRYRHALLAPLVHGFGLAVVLQVGMVMHQHFPRRYFKYILLTAALLLVTRILVHLLRLVAFPRPEWLLRQYREAYEHFQCPACAYPIRRGPLKHAFWTRRSLKRLSLPPADPSADGPYVCPACGTVLFEECPTCHATRHSLLPTCESCGATKALPAPSA